jgi:hypothetical protein
MSFASVFRLNIRKIIFANRINALVVFWIYRLGHSLEYLYFVGE